MGKEFVYWKQYGNMYTYVGGEEEEVLEFTIHPGVISVYAGELTVHLSVDAVQELIEILTVQAVV